MSFPQYHLQAPPILTIDNNEALICRHVRSAQIGNPSVCIFHCVSIDAIEESNMSQSAKNAVMDLKISAEVPRTRARSGICQCIPAIPKEHMSDLHTAMIVDGLDRVR